MLSKNATTLAKEPLAKSAPPSENLVGKPLPTQTNVNSAASQKLTCTGTSLCDNQSTVGKPSSQESTVNSAPVKNSPVLTVGKEKERCEVAGSERPVSETLVECIRVENLPQGCTAQELQDVFDPISPVQKCDVSNRDSFALVYFKSSVPLDIAFSGMCYVRGQRLHLQQWLGANSTGEQLIDKKKLKPPASAIKESSQKPRTKISDTDVFITGLPDVWKMDSADQRQMKLELRNLMSNFGAVSEVKIRGIIERRRCYAFVSFGNQAAAQAAVQSTYTPFLTYRDGCYPLTVMPRIVDDTSSGIGNYSLFSFFIFSSVFQKHR